MGINVGNDETIQIGRMSFADRPTRVFGLESKIVSASSASKTGGRLSSGPLMRLRSKLL